jgi:hypothetical protein
VAAVFTDDVEFQGLRPYGVGRNAVADYYDSQPDGMAVTYPYRPNFTRTACRELRP